MLRPTKVDILNCPFCGGTEKTLYIGPLSASSWGIECKCGCAIEEEMFDKYSRKHRKELAEWELTGLSWSEALACFHMLNVVDKWNKRV